MKMDMSYMIENRFRDYVDECIREAIRTEVQNVVTDTLGYRHSELDLKQFIHDEVKKWITPEKIKDAINNIKGGNGNV